MPEADALAAVIAPAQRLLHGSMPFSAAIPAPAMTPEALRERYRQLRGELDAAYAAPVWDAELIDRITGQMLPLERALALLQASGGGDVPGGPG